MRTIVTLFLLAAFSGFAADTGHSLFNDKNLDGWQEAHGLSQWHVEGKVLRCESEKGSWLKTESEYSDFVLKLEYRLAPGANSGISLRCPAKGDPAHDGVEVQLLDDAYPFYKNLKPEQHTGAIYMQVAPRTHAANPAGEWNSCEITCRGSEIVITINGIEVNRVNLNAQKTGRDGRTALNDRPLHGQIALEARVARVEFRKIAIEKL